MERIVIFRPGALGDTLLMFPALAALRRSFPDAAIWVIGNAPALALAKDAGLADLIFDFDLPWWAEVFSEDGIRSPEVREMLTGARLVVLWMGRDVEPVGRNLLALGARQVISAPGRPPESGQTHAAEHLLKTLLPVLGEPEQRLPAVTLPVATEMRQWTEQAWARPGLVGERILALHPGSGGRGKCWPPERFAALAQRFIDAGWRALVIEGPADGSLVDQVMRALPSERAQVLRGLSLPQLAALLARAALYVGNDSGVTHLSALVGAPTLALFGPTSPALWSPRGPRVRVVWHGAVAREVRGAAGHPMTDLSVDEVFAAARALLIHQDQSTDLADEIC